MEIIYSLDKILDTAKTIWKIGEQQKIWAFHGEIGSGKTTLIHALCDVKGVKEVVGSPTFSIINEYSFRKNGQEQLIYHIDLYRLVNDEEIISAGIEDCLYSDHICFVEWPEKIQHLFPDNSLNIYLDAIEGQTRKLRIETK
jgi:tRNA threonylcarbamoyladenosine biosynthesis protein TsaE